MLPSGGGYESQRSTDYIAEKRKQIGGAAMSKNTTRPRSIHHAVMNNPEGSAVSRMIGVETVMLGVAPPNGRPLGQSERPEECVVPEDVQPGCTRRYVNRKCGEAH